MSRIFKGSGLAALAVAMALSLVAMDHAEARKGGSLGSRGTRTYQAPAATQTAPNTAAPIQRSTTPQPGPQQGMGAQGAQGMAAQRPSMFGNGFGGALMRGLLIGGLVGMLFGGGLGGLAGMLGLLLQVGLIALAIFVVMRLLRGRQPAAAAAGAGAYARNAGGPSGGSVPGAGARSASAGSRPVPPATGPATTGPSAAGPAAAGPAAATHARPAQPHAPAGKGGDEIGIKPADLDAFEGLLGRIQDAFSREDQAELMADTTPEMFGFLSDELRNNAEAGMRNQVSDVKLLQGDVAEAWREGARDYATVAMRYAIRDQMVERATGKVVSGAEPGETTEIWTFVRERGPFGTGPWKLSAIQET